MNMCLRLTLREFRHLTAGVKERGKVLLRRFFMPFLQKRIVHKNVFIFSGGCGIIHNVFLCAEVTE